MSYSKRRQSRNRRNKRRNSRQQRKPVWYRRGGEGEEPEKKEEDKGFFAGITEALTPKAEEAPAAPEEPKVEEAPAAPEAPKAEEAPAPAPAEDNPSGLGSLFGNDKPATPTAATKKKKHRRGKYYTPSKLRAACARISRRRRHGHGHRRSEQRRPSREIIQKYDEYNPYLQV